MKNRFRNTFHATRKPGVKCLISLILVAVAFVSVPAAKASKSSAPEGKSHHATLDGTRIHYKSYGKGREALVLIHGWTCNLDFWRDQVPDLAKRNRVLAIDLPGHGQSDKPQIAYSMDLFARAVDAMMRDAHVERAVLVGHSMGTPIARQFYRKYAQKTLAIVVVDGPLSPFDKKMIDGLIAGVRGPNYKEVGKQAFAGMAGPNVSPELKERIVAAFINPPQHVVVSAMEGMADEAIWGPDKINVPVLAIMARATVFWPPDTEQIFRSIAPNLDFQMWDGVGHFLMMEKPKQFNDAVLAFLDKNSLLKK